MSEGRRPGRPPIMTLCVRCHEPRPRRDYVGVTSGVCKPCRKAIREGTPNVVAATVEPVSVKSEMREAVFGLIALNAATAGVAKLTLDLGLPPRCECCFEFRHVARDTYGGVALVCARCEYQIRATGCCHLHHSRVYYPELLQPAAVPTPVEVEALFFVPESVKPKYDVTETADAET